MAEIYTKSVIQIGDETFRNLPAQVDRDQEVSYDANLKSQQAISTANAAQAKATEAKNAADAAQTTANAAQTKANEAKTVADTAQATADAAQTKANEAFNLADSATELATQVQGELADALGSKVVRYDETQLLSEEQMLTARGNIEAAPITGTVRYDINQSLTDEQKTKARTNIGAGTPVTVDQNLIENSTNAVAGGPVYRETTTNRNAIINLQGLLMNFAQDSAVRYDMAQTLTDEQKQLARSNIGVTEQGIVIDNELSTTSENPVQNRAITAQINLINTNVTNAQTVATNASGAAHQALQNASTAQSRANVSVRYDAQQVLTAAQEKQARGNISAKYNGGGQTLASNITSLNSTATATFDADIYKNIYVEVIPKTDSGYIGTTIPIAALETTDKRYQLTDEINYVSFKLKLSAKNGTVTLTYSMATRSQDTAKIVLIMAIP